MGNGGRGFRMYVPVLKTKAGECWAVANLPHDAAQNITPLFEIHPHKVKDGVLHAEDVCDAIASVWGTERAFYLDTVWLHGAAGDLTVLGGVFETAREFGLQAMPVVRPCYDDASLDVLCDILAEDGRGYLLRVGVDALVAADAIDMVVGHIGVARADVDFLLDYRQHSMSLAADVPRVPHLGGWRRFIAGSGTFPRSLSQLPLDEWHLVPRHDWNSWVAGAAVARRPEFCDYVIRDPGPPAAGGEPSANLRYTRSDAWNVRVGRKLKHGFASDMFEICQSLV
ncbi:MAG: hypothetical protein JSS02_26050, partial [Planctomycetes bacterium]|nr:hypothetical protein [Planctomycetota bacterium]